MLTELVIPFADIFELLALANTHPAIRQFILARPKIITNVLDGELRAIARSTRSTVRNADWKFWDVIFEVDLFESHRAAVDPMDLIWLKPPVFMRRSDPVYVKYHESLFIGLFLLAKQNGRDDFYDAITTILSSVPKKMLNVEAASYYDERVEEVYSHLAPEMVRGIVELCEYFHYDAEEAMVLQLTSIDRITSDFEEVDADGGQ